MADDGKNENDDEILEDWEDLEDTGELDKRLEELRSTADKDETNRRTSGSGPVVEDSTRTQYQPQVKILKRQVNENGYQGAENRKVQVKSLEERQAEYAKARERILGPEYGSEESDSSPSESQSTQTQSVMQR
ncbi:SUZ domain-containing protein 1-like [Lineus longissimus]|uniref:SUZ domain-containing protein 1-like n=1 Tax=Lineus longissimus TaxID=88925 RepID=UPI002B4F0B17